MEPNKMLSNVGSWLGGAVRALQQQHKLAAPISFISHDLAPRHDLAPHWTLVPSLTGQASTLVMSP